MFLLKNKYKATSIVEAIVVLFIVVSGIVGMYQVFGNSKKLSESTSHKIQAIQMAREAIEAVKNIRDTNWQLFASDTKNCWNVWNYDSDCVGDDSQDNDISSTPFYNIININNKWVLNAVNISGDYKYSNKEYRDNFQVYLNKNGFFAQKYAGDTRVLKEMIPIFTREIKIDYIEDTNGDGNTDSNDEKMKVTVLVQWVDNSTSNIQKVEFSNILTNWRK